MRYVPSCLDALRELLTGLEEDGSPVHLISYERFQEWKDCLTVFLDAGIISKSARVAEKIPCAGCESIVGVEPCKAGYFYHCSKCGFTDNPKPEEVTLYETSPEMLADYVRNMTALEGNGKVISTDRLYFLGKREFHNGEYALFIARGLTWKEAKTAIYNHCQPPNPRTHILLFSTCCEDVDTGNSRIVQVPLIDLIRIEQGKFVFREDHIQRKLIGVYNNARSIATKAEGEKRFTDQVIKAVERKEIRHGDTEKWRREAMKEYGLTTRKFDDLWTQYVPQELRRRSRPRKSYS